ncbi:MAG: Ig-like domain-containing protein [Bacilli bacterium]|jgi:uncharacterized protein YjdB
MKKKIVLLPLLLLVLAACTPDNSSTDPSNSADEDSISESISGPVAVSNLSISADISVSSLRVGDNVQLTADVLPAAAEDKSVTWASNAESIATVDANGLVSCLAVGEVTISATSSSVATVSDTINLSVVFNYDENWPSAQIATFLGDEIATVIPSAASDSGYYHAAVIDTTGQYADMFIIEIETAVATAEDDYLVILEAANYSTSDANYESFGYECIDQALTVEVDVLYSEGILSLSIYRYEDLYGPAPEMTQVWPADAINEFLGAELGATVPSFVSDSVFYNYIGGDETESYLVVSTAYEAVEGETAYSAALTTAGWTIDDSQYDTVGLIASNAAKTVEIIFYVYGGDMVWGFFLTTPSGGGVAEDGVATFDLLTENQLSTKNDNESVWTLTPVTMTISKGASTVNVGNTSYFSNPLRIYAAQVVTFAVEEGYVIDSVVITTDSGKPVTDTSGAAIVGGVANVADLVVTITANADVNVITLTPTAQIRWSQVVVNFSEIPA